jgi:signal peptidase I
MAKKQKIGLKRRIFIYFLLFFSITFFVRVYKVSDISMNYALFDGDLVVVENFSIGIHFPSLFFYIDKHIWSNEEAIKRGDILAFRHPLDRRLYIKRCVALPKDVIFQHNKNLYLQIEGNSTKTLNYAQKFRLESVDINGSIWIKNPYQKCYPISHEPSIQAPKMLLEYPKEQIPPHHYFFMGDFRDDSTDSRFFGAVHYDYIYYRAVLLIQPFRDLERSIRANQSIF